MPPLLARTPEVDYAELGRRYLEQSQWRAGGRRFYIDKLPPNFMLLGFIRRALPQAKVIHMVREPMDVCFSNYRAMFGNAYGYSYDFDSLAHHHGQYRAADAALARGDAGLRARPAVRRAGPRQRSRVRGGCSISAACRTKPGCGDNTRNTDAGGDARAARRCASRSMRAAWANGAATRSSSRHCRQCWNSRLTAFVPRDDARTPDRSPARRHVDAMRYLPPPKLILYSSQ